MQRTYEIRLLNRDGGIAVLYLTQCANHEDAKDRIRRMKAKRYERYEVWCDGHMVGEGPCLHDGRLE